MTKTLALALLLGGLLLPSAAFAYSPSVSIVPSDVYLDDVPLVDYTWSCQDLGSIGGAYYLASLFRSGQYVRTVSSCSSSERTDFLGEFEGMNGDFTSLIVVYDENIAGLEEGYDPSNLELLTQEGNDWLISTSTVFNHSGNRP